MILTNSNMDPVQIATTTKSRFGPVINFLMIWAQYLLHNLYQLKKCRTTTARYPTAPHTQHSTKLSPSSLPPPPATAAAAAETMSASKASDDHHFNEYDPGHMPMPDFEALARDIQNLASRHVGAPPARRPRHRGGRDGGAGAMGPWAHPPTRCARVGAALTASDREGIITTCRSMTAPWVIEKAERARHQWGEGGDRRGGGGRGRVGGDAVVGGAGSF